MSQSKAIAIVFAASMSCARPVPAPVDMFRMHGLETESYSHALAAHSCGPTDGPALTLYLLDTQSKVIPPSTRYVRVTVYQDPSLLAHQRIEWQGSAGLGEAVRCSPDSCVAVNSGHVNFGSIKTGKSVDGDADLHFSDGVQVRQRFHARWPRSRVVVCG
jgi:hypothetical protein